MPRSRRSGQNTACEAALHDSSRPDLEQILDGLAQASPQGARRVQARIRAITELLARFPEIGQATIRPEMRRLVVTPFPYLIFYRATADAVIIHAVRHSARGPHTMP
ncbi:type II toxin-antitoxin system RelE/ParE family toxin [Lichenihabitans sp. Uapishka_5]|uniref:type II toxin-antitoxin system RelE/ParE family toxin n=1 Tax=Lichenihabitans sp. Uapishka_5 TaxID=3037302 RepID=UPI0029E828CF|nr:type II toxin-antitoxin system RelE/ParE family toxin [Lichenihabitans sp. Uapishka_5]